MCAVSIVKLGSYRKLCHIFIYSSMSTVDFSYLMTYIPCAIGLQINIQGLSKVYKMYVI